MEDQMTVAVLVGVMIEGLNQIKKNNGKDECIAAIAATLDILFQHFPSEFLIANNTVMELIEQGEL